jgi:hypothetical protein
LETKFGSQRERERESGEETTWGIKRAMRKTGRLKRKRQRRKKKEGKIQVEG